LGHSAADILTGRPGNPDDRMYQDRSKTQQMQQDRQNLLLTVAFERKFAKLRRQARRILSTAQKRGDA
jgi:hypothetical protein